jgi:hypothetical protein
MFKKFWISTAAAFGGSQMRNRTDRERDRAAFLTPPYETEPNVLLAHAIRELCYTIEDAAELIATSLSDRPDVMSVTRAAPRRKQAARQ